MQSSFTELSRNDLRTHFRALRCKLTQTEQLTAARKLVAQCSQKNVLDSVQSVALYLANDGELDPQILIQHCWEKGMTVYLPVLHPFATGRLAFFEYTKLTPMKKNRFGILEPKLDVRTITKISDLDVVFMPLVAFDTNGHRLGMGSGFYDRTLAKVGNSTKTQLIGLAHDCQQAEALTSQSWDIPLSKIVTPTRVISVNS